MGLSASINALSGAFNGLMNILFILVWMSGCWRWVLDSRAVTHTKKCETKTFKQDKIIQSLANKSNFPVCY